MKIKRKYEYEGNKAISVDIESDTITQNAKEVLNNVLRFYTNDIEKLIYMTKIFTKGANNSLVKISIVNGTNVEYLVSMQNEKIINYYSSKTKEDKKISEVSYNNESGYDYRIYDKENVLKILEKETDLDYNLNNMSVLPITELEKNIIEIYNFIFKDYPDFSKIEDRQRCKYALCNLYMLGMFNYFDLDFECYNNEINSFSLDKKFDKLCGYGKMKFTNLNLSPEYLYKLKCIANYLNLSLEDLKNLAVVSYNEKFGQDYETQFSRTR